MWQISECGLSAEEPLAKADVRHARLEVVVLSSRTRIIWSQLGTIVPSPSERAVEREVSLRVVVDGRRVAVRLVCALLVDGVEICQERRVFDCDSPLSHHLVLSTRLTKSMCYCTFSLLVSGPLYGVLVMTISSTRQDRAAVHPNPGAEAGSGTIRICSQTAERSRGWYRLPCPTADLASAARLLRRAACS
jgi:hypothetical protein